MSPKKSPETLIEKLASEPAELLDTAADALAHLEKSATNKKPLRLAEEYWHTLGPGLTTGASDDDPSGIATYSQVGAKYGFQLLWLSWFTFPLMAVIQEMCARIGIVTGHGLAANIRERYPRGVLYFVTLLLFAANTFNIGADLGAMAKASQLLVPDLSFMWLVVGFALFSLLLQIFTTYARYAKYLKYLALVLFAYVLSAFFSNLDWGHVLSQFVLPTVTFGKDQLYLICAILGTTISPYLFFWQTSQEVEDHELKVHSHKEVSWHQSPTKKDLQRVRTDVWSGMFFSNLVMFFIIAACAGTLYMHGITNITTAADAALALRPIAGDAAYFLFAIGIIGTGLLAIPVLAGSTSYAIAESFGWRHGLYRKLKQAYAFYGVIIISMLLGVGLNFLNFDPIQVLIYSAVGNGIIAPVILFFIVRMSSNKEVMRGDVNHPFATFIGWVTIVIMVVAGIAAIVSLFL